MNSWAKPYSGVVTQKGWPKAPRHDCTAQKKVWRMPVVEDHIIRVTKKG